MPDQKKIALAVIAGDDAIEQGFGKMIDSVARQIDGVFVAFNGTSATALQSILATLSGYNIPQVSVQGFEWEDDFAAMRNHSFDLVPDDFDWILWLDTDDVFVADDYDLQSLVDWADVRRAHCVFVNYIYQWDRKTGKTLTSHMKERLIRRDARYRWHYPLHENCLGPMSARNIEFDGRTCVRHDRGEAEPKRERNRRIIKKWYEDCGGQEPRAVMYMAHETFAMAEEMDPEYAFDKTTLYKAAIKLYQDFTRMSPSGDDTYACNLMVSDALRKMRRFNDSINIDMQGVKMEPQRPAAYVSIAMTHIAGGDYEDAITWAELALTRTGGKATLHAVEPLDADYKPMMILGDAYLNLGDAKRAEKWFEEAYRIFPDEFTKGRLSEAANAVRKQMRQHEPADPNTLRKARWGDSPERSIAFFQPGSIEPWNPDVLASSGLGGTETCVIKLAEAFARNGWRTVIFGSPGDWANTIGPEGIEWYEAGAFHPDEPFTAFVALRDPTIFEANVKAQNKFLWLHDVTMGPVRFSDDGRDLFAEVDGIVCVSEFQAQVTVDAYMEYQGDMAPPVVIPNSFEREMWMRTGDEGKRDPKKMIYASSPDRGLTRLLELWPDIEQRVPGATLDIFYGWEAIDKIIESGHPAGIRLAHFKERTERQLTKLLDEGYEILWHGRQPQSVLASHMKVAGVMPYPANFLETFGLVHAQAITAGMIPVVPNLGSLPQIMGDNLADFIVPGSPDGREYGPRFVEAVGRASEVDDALRFISERTIPGITWEAAYEAWSQLITNGEKNS